MAFILHVDESYPKCGKPVAIIEIERHPSRPDLAIQNFQCGDCGPVKSRIYSLKPGVPPPDLTA
jgi:hypothetical protein